MMDLVFFMLIIVYLCLFVGMIFIKSETSMKKEGREEGKKMKEGGGKVAVELNEGIKKQ